MGERVLGGCRVCGGDVIEKITVIYPEGIIDEFFKTTKLDTSIYCEKCGVKYEFYPKTP